MMGRERNLGVAMGVDEPWYDQLSPGINLLVDMPRPALSDVEYLLLVEYYHAILECPVPFTVEAYDGTVLDNYSQHGSLLSLLA